MAPGHSFIQTTGLHAFYLRCKVIVTVLFSISHQAELARIQAASRLFHHILCRNPCRSVFIILLYVPHRQNYLCPFPYLLDTKHSYDIKRSGPTQPRKWTVCNAMASKAPARDRVLVGVWMQAGSALIFPLSSRKHINIYYTHKTLLLVSLQLFKRAKFAVTGGIYENGAGGIPFALWTLFPTSVKYRWCFDMFQSQLDYS